MLNRKCLPLKDVKSLRCLNAYQALVLGLNMLPAYASIEMTDFTKMIEDMDEEGQVKIFTEAARMVELDPKEVKAMVCFCTDKNGIPYTEENIKNLSPSDFVEIIVTVCMEMARNIHIDLLTDSEKKNFATSQLTFAEHS